MYKQFHIPAAGTGAAMVIALLIPTAFWARGIDSTGLIQEVARQGGGGAGGVMLPAILTGAASVLVSVSLGIIIHRLRPGGMMLLFLAMVGSLILLGGLEHLATAAFGQSWLAGALAWCAAAAAVGAAIALPAVAPRVIGFLQSARNSEDRGQALEAAARELARVNAALLSEARSRNRDDEIQRAANEQALQRSETRFGTLADIAPVGIFHTDAAGQHQYMNGTWCQICGLSAGQARDGGWQRAIHPEDRERVVAEWTENVRQIAPFQSEFRILRPDGLIAWVLGQARPQLDASGEIVGYVGTMTDITDRKQSEVTQLRLAAIVSSSDDAIIGQTVSGIITSWNCGAERIFGYGAEEVLGRHVSMLAPADRARESREILEKIRMGERVLHFETVRVREDSRQIDVSLTVSPIRNHSGKIIGVSKIAQDISQRKQHEAELAAHQGALEAANSQLAENNQRLSVLYQTAQRFVDDVSHEFRTPLAVIKGYSEILRDGIAGPLLAEQRQFLQLIVDRTRDLTQMVDDLLDSSKLRAGALRVDRKACAAEDIMNSVRPTLDARAAGKVEIRLEVEEDLPEIFADAEKAARVLVNLAVNAIKFSPEKSSITLWARRTPEGDVEIGVTDHGPGIPAGDLAVIFQRFRQLQTMSSTSKGFGLGLNIARELVFLNLGKMNVTSAPGKGSSFSFTLPRNDPETIVRRLLENLQRRAAADGSLAMLRVSPDPPAAARKELRGFIASCIRPDDLILPAPDGTSFILFGHATSPEGWLESLAKAGSNIQNYSHSLKLCGFKTELVGSWAYPGQSEAAVEGCLEQLLQEPAYA